MKTVVLVGVALTMRGAVMGAVENPKLVLGVYDSAGVMGSDLAEAVGEARRIFRAAGIDLGWAESGPVPGDTVPAISVDLVSSAGREFPGDVLGRAVPVALSGARVTLFLDNINSRASQNALPLAILLGDALAHQFRHVILGAGAGDHRYPGLMCGQRGPMQLDRTHHGALKFSQSQAGALRQSLQERLSERHLNRCPSALL